MPMIILYASPKKLLQMPIGNVADYEREVFPLLPFAPRNSFQIKCWSRYRTHILKGARYCRHSYVWPRIKGIAHFSAPISLAKNCKCPAPALHDDVTVKFRK